MDEIHMSVSDYPTLCSSYLWKVYSYPCLSLQSVIDKVHQFMFNNNQINGITAMRDMMKILPFILMNGLLIGIFLWENETGKTTISKYPLFQQLKEVTTGTPDQVGIMSLIPVVRNLKIARFVNPFISPIEKLHSKIFHEESSDESPK